MLQQLSIRKKFLLVLVGPALGLLLLAGLTARGYLADSGEAGDAMARASFSSLTGDLVDALADEAVINQFEANGLGADGREDARARTDQVREAWFDAVAPFAVVDDAGTIELVQRLDEHRESTAGTTPALAFGADSGLIWSVAGFDASVAAAAENDVRGDLVRSADLTETMSALTDAHLLGIWSAASGTVPTAADAAPDLGGRLATVDLQVLAHNASTTQQIADPSDAYRSMADAFTVAVPGQLISADAADWSAEAAPYADAIAAARQAETTAASTAASAADSDASGALRTLGILALVGLGLGAVAALFISNDLVKAIRDVNDEAAAVAKNDLPVLAAALRSGEPARAMDRPLVEPEGTDEVSELLATINDIRESADVVGREQTATLQSGIADMFINLARRNQTLVDRQLEVIDQLEADERDPERLSFMYRVDHLATRMRRNAESLLVLAGHTQTRRRGPAVQLREVVRVAIGEVEDYRRIIPIAVDDQDVAGHVAQDLAHLLSELMENATQSSPPGTVADVIGAKEADGTYRIQVIDRGTGIEAGRLAELNAVLADPPTNSLSMSRTMGLTVVGRLAERLGINVHLAPGSESGTVAMVVIPELVAREWRGETASPLDEQAIQSVPGGFGGLTTALPELEDETPLDADEPAAFDPAGFDPAAFSMEAAPAPTVIETPDMAADPDPAPAFDAPVAEVHESPAAPDMDDAPLGAGLLSGDLIGDVAEAPEFEFGGGEGIELPTPAESMPVVDVPGYEPEALILESLVEPIAEETSAEDAPPAEAPAFEATALPDPPVSLDEIPDPVAEAPVFTETPPTLESVGEQLAEAAPAVSFDEVESVDPMPEEPAAAAPGPFDALAEQVSDDTTALPDPPAFPDTPAFPDPPTAADVFDAEAPAVPTAESVEPAPFPPTEFVAPTTPEPEPASAEATFPAVTPEVAEPAPSAFGEPAPAEPVAEPTLADVAKLTATEPAALVPPPVVATPDESAEADPDGADTTPSGLIRRKRKAPSAIDDGFGVDRTSTAAPSKRSPDQVKSMLSRYKSGLERGRTDGES